MFVAMGAGAGFCIFVQQYCFGVMGQRLTRRLRQLLFGTILRQVLQTCLLSCFGLVIRMQPYASPDLLLPAFPHTVRLCLSKPRHLQMPASCHLQEIAFFDLDENSSGALSSQLSVDTASIRGAVGDQLGLLAQNLVTFAAGYIIAFINGCVQFDATSSALAVPCKRHPASTPVHGCLNDVKR